MFVLDRVHSFEPTSSEACRLHIAGNISQTLIAQSITTPEVVKSSTSNLKDVTKPSTKSIDDGLTVLAALDIDICESAQGVSSIHARLDGVLSATDPVGQALLVLLEEEVHAERTR